ncbi:HPF/RaiA family ribosome-associated protein [Patescibacteria group bacterium]|nr:HPF/RaiA family ribosome-associated protein [Patescibacteria group bacterium]
MNNNIQLNSIGVELTEELKNYIDKKLKSIEKFIDFNDPEITGDIRLTKDSSNLNGKIYRVEMSFMTTGKKYGVSADGNTLYEAIDEAKDSIVRKITDYKAKKQSLFKKGGARIKVFLKRFSR